MDVPGGVDISRNCTVHLLLATEIAVSSEVHGDRQCVCTTEDSSAHIQWCSGLHSSNLLFVIIKPKNWTLFKEASAFEDVRVGVSFLLISG